MLIGKTASQAFALFCWEGFFSFWFYFKMLHAVWVWHLHYLETCFISLFQTKSATNWFEHLDDFCEHMFPLSSYFSYKNAQGHLTACKLWSFWGERQHWIIPCMWCYCSVLPFYMHIVLKIRFWASGGKGLCFSGYQMSVFRSTISLTDRVLCLCIQTSSSSGHFAITQWNR